MTEMDAEPPRRCWPAPPAALGGLPLSRARAQAANTIRIGVLTDMSGPYRDTTGPGSVVMTQAGGRRNSAAAASPSR